MMLVRSRSSLVIIQSYNAFYTRCLHVWLALPHVLKFECTARPVDTLTKQQSDMGNVQCDVYKDASSRYKQCLTALNPTPRFSLPTQPLASTICSLVSQNEFNSVPARGRRE